ncbi:MAG: transglycosylase SLT domain-containing protein [Bacteroidia bacterium]|nr:transglycosylase SLT domain-containing protein [Bacteroidia bacterium]
MCGSVIAQEHTDKNGNNSMHDPILEQLDQLTILNQVLLYNDQKYGTGDPYCTTDVEIAPVFSDEVFQERFDQINSPIHFEYNRNVASFINLYAVRKRLLSQKLIGLSDFYFPMVESVLDQEGLPMELKYLAMVESALNPAAVSRAGATGLWQFIYSTGKIYDLEISSYIDERKDPYLSTVAACRYFKSMYKIYGDWLLVIAAYNCGPGNVNKAIRRSGGHKNVWKIMPYLPRETRGYVPAFVAVSYLMMHQEEHQLKPLKPTFNYFEVDTFKVNYGVSLFELAETLDISYEAMTYLNPIYKRKFIPATKDKPMILRLPIDKNAAFLAYHEKRKVQSYLASNKVDKNTVVDPVEPVNYRTETIMIEELYKIGAGETLEDIAIATGCSAEEIRNWNDLKDGDFKEGSQLKVYSRVEYKVSADDVLPNTHAHSNRSYKNDGKFIYYYVQKGDTLWDIANNYRGVSVTQLKQYNGITNSRSIKPGMKIKIKPVG